MFHSLATLPQPLAYAIVALVLVPALASIILLIYFLLTDDIQRILSRHKLSTLEMIFLLSIIGNIISPLLAILIVIQYQEWPNPRIAEAELILEYVMSYEWATVPAILLAAVLYRIRGAHRFLYGTLEVAVGLVAIWAGLHVNGPTLEKGIIIPPQDQYGVILARGLSLASGVYIVIRGLDNMAQKLPTRLHFWWDVLFPKGRKVN